MSLPLRKIVFSIAILIIIILGGLLIFGIRQYQLQNKIDIVISQSEKMIFQFSSIREQIIDSIINNKYDQIDIVINDIEKLHLNLNDIINNSYIPNEYKLSFLNRIDLQGLMLLVRQSSSSRIDNGRLQQLNRECRIMNERLIMFDRVIVDYAKSSIIAFQSIIIGTLAIVVFIIVLILVMLHKYIAVPLLELVFQVSEVAQGRRNDITLNMFVISSEVFNLATEFHNLLQTRLIDSAEIARNNKILFAVHKAGIAISHARKRDELFNDVIKALRFNDEYCLVLISLLDEATGQLYAFVHDETASKIDQGMQFDIAAFLGDGFDSNEKFNPAQRAIREKKAVVEYDILADTPKGHFKNTPFAQSKINCVALPLVWEKVTFGAIIIYSCSSLDSSFHKDELKLLNMMASDVAIALSYLEMKDEFNLERERFLAIAANFDIMTFSIASNGRMISWDENVSRIIGIQFDSLAGKDWHDFVSYCTDEEKVAVEQFIQSNASYYQCQLLINKRNGEQRLFRCRMSKGAMKFKNEYEIYCICQDITELDRSRHELEMVRLENRKFFDAVPDPVFITSSSGVIFDLNDKAQEVFKAEKMNILGKNIFQYIYQDRTSDYPSLLKSTMLENKKAVLRERFDNLGGEFLVNIVPLPAVAADQARLILIVNNSSLGTEQRAEEFVRTFQLSNLGELATGVAHEINNLSNGIINYAQILADESIEKDCKLDPERIDLLNKIIREGERIARIVQKLLFYSRANGDKKELIRVNDVIEDVLLLVKHQFKNDGIKIELDLPEGLQPVAFESSRLQLVFLCILNNARRALNDRFSGKNDNKRIELKGVMELRNGKSWLKIMVTDWGIGISPEIMPRIFDPIFTTKPLGEEGGMGLAVSRQLLIKNNGTISIASEPGNYTTVTIELPIQAGQTA